MTKNELTAGKRKRASICALLLAALIIALPLSMPHSSAKAELGTGWLKVDGLPNEKLNAITFGNGKFVIVGTGGLIMTSRNALEWKAAPDAPEAETTITWNDVAFGDGLFVAVGERLQTAGDTHTRVGLIATSPDGAHWELQEFYAKDAQAVANRTVNTVQIKGVEYAGGQFMTAGTTGFEVMTSPDGKDWEIRDTKDLNAKFSNGPYVFPTYFFPTFNKIYWFDGIYYALSEMNYYGLCISYDGDNWENTNLQDRSHLNIKSLTHDGTSVVTIAGDGIRTAEFTRLDGKTLTSEVGINTIGYAHGIAYADGVYAAVGEAGYSMHAAIISDDLTNWATITNPYGNRNNWYDIINVEGVFIAVGEEGRVMLSGKYTPQPDTLKYYKAEYGEMLWSGKEVYPPPKPTATPTPTPSPAPTATPAPTPLPEGVKVSPVMTGNKAPAPYVAYASGLEGDNNSEGNIWRWEPFHAFDGVYQVDAPLQNSQYKVMSNAGWSSRYSHGTRQMPQWLAIDMGSETAVDIYRLTNTDYAKDGTTVTHRPAVDFTFQGSNDNATFVDLHSVTGRDARGFGETSEYMLSETANYRYYRLYVTKAGTDGNSVAVTIGELALYALE